MATAQLPQATTIKDYEPLNSSTIRGKFAVGLGLFLVLLTGGLWYVAWGDLPSSIDRPNLPPNMFAGFMFCFFGAPGLFLVALGALDLRRQSRVRHERELYPNEPWRWDHSWSTDATTDIGLRQVSQGLLAWMMGLGIIVPVNYVFIAEADFSFAAFGLLVLGLLDLILLLSFGTMIYRILAQLLHGRGRLRYQQYPLRLGERAELSLQPHAAFDDVEELKVTVRCVEEQCEARRTTGNTSDAGRATTVRKIGLQHYSVEQTIPGDDVRSSEAVPLTFELPDAPELQSRLSEVPSTHWELLVVGKRPGIDFNKRFLLPVY